MIKDYQPGQGRWKTFRLLDIHFCFRVPLPSKSASQELCLQPLLQAVILWTWAQKLVLGESAVRKTRDQDLPYQGYPPLPVEMGPMTELSTAVPPEVSSVPSRVSLPVSQGKGLNWHVSFNTSHFYSWQGGREGTLQLGGSYT